MEATCMGNEDTSNAKVQFPHLPNWTHKLEKMEFFRKESSAKKKISMLYVSAKNLGVNYVVVHFYFYNMCIQKEVHLLS